MKTACPACRTVFRITSGELRARSGQVRCGRCQTVFSALDELSDDASPLLLPTTLPNAQLDDHRRAAPTSRLAASDAASVDTGVEVASATDSSRSRHAAQTDAHLAEAATPLTLAASSAAASIVPGEHPSASNEPAQARRHWLGEQRQPAPGPGRQRREAQVLGALVGVLALLLAGQLVFQLRTTISLSVPGLQPWLAALSELVGSDLPLPRRADLLAIEASDLQSEPGRTALLTLQATLRNRAGYAQAYPAIELALTDTRDKVIVRRVLLPEEYLPPGMLAAGPFPASSDLDIRLRLETRSVEAAGYRLYLFYP